MSESLERCWNRTGVRGDATCERLAAVGHCRNCGEYTRAGRLLLEREATSQVCEEWGRMLAEPKEAVVARRESLVLFAVGREYLALPTIFLERVTGPRPIHTLPSRSNGVFIGLVNMDGDLLPCFSVAAALQLSDCNPSASPGRMLLLHKNGIRLVCVVDQVIGVIRVSPDELEPPPVTVARNNLAFTKAVFPIKSGRAGLLDGDKFTQRLIRGAAL